MKNKIIGACILGVGLLLSVFFWAPLAPSGETLFAASRFSPGGGSERSPGLWQLIGTVISPTNSSYTLSVPVSSGSSTFTTALNVPYITDQEVYFSDRGTAAGENDLTFNSSTNMLSVNGQVSSTQLIVGVGTAADASIRTAADADSGIYFATNGQTTQFVNNGLQTMSISSAVNILNGRDIVFTSNNATDIGTPNSSAGFIYSSSTVQAGGATNAFLAGVGTIGAPAYSFIGDPDTGIYQSTANNMVFTAGGIGHMAILSNQVRPTVNNTTQLGSSSIAWSDIYAAGTAFLANVSSTGNVTTTKLTIGPLRSGATNQMQVTSEASTAVPLLLRNTGATGFTGIELAPTTLGVQGFVGYDNANNSLRYNNLNAAGYQTFLTNNVERLRITNTSVSTTVGLAVNGNVTTTGYIYAPSLSNLGVTGDFVCQNNTTNNLEVQLANCTVSSIRFKEHVESMSSSEMMAMARKLRSVSYDYKNGDKGMLGTSHDQGFIAEEVAMIDPYLVAWEEATPEALAEIKRLYPKAIMNRNGKKFVPRTVDYMKLSVILNGAIQNLDERLSTLEKMAY